MNRPHSFSRPGCILDPSGRLCRISSTSFSASTARCGPCAFLFLFQTEAGRNPDPVSGSSGSLWPPGMILSSGGSGVCFASRGLAFQYHSALSALSSWQAWLGKLSMGNFSLGLEDLAWKAHWACVDIPELWSLVELEPSVCRKVSRTRDQDRISSDG